MPENQKDRDQASTPDTSRDAGQGPEQQNTSDQEEMNPQQGAEWSNYRTRELSGNNERGGTAERSGGGEGNATTPGNE